MPFHALKIKQLFQNHRIFTLLYLLSLDYYCLHDNFDKCQSYIYRFNSFEPSENYYKPGENLENLFRDMVTQPFKRRLPSLSSELENGKYTRMNSLRKSILEQGQAYFDESSEGFSSEDLVLLYCVNYMPMHLYSSYHIFTTKLFLPVSSKVIFIDFGCGPLTSGIAFWAAARGTRQIDITYVGIDNSQTMLSMAKKMNQYGHDESGRSNEPFYQEGQLYLISNYEGLPELLADIGINVGNSDDVLIIFNLCYFLQSKTFRDPSNIEKLGTLLELANYLGAKICVVYQDPVGRGFQERWHNLKSWAIPYPSAFNDSGFMSQDPTEVARIKYDTLWGEQNTVNVSYDSFNNFYFLGLTLC